MKYIQEFQSTNFHSPPAMFLEIMLILGLGAAVWYGRRRQFTEVLLIAGFGHLSLVVVRNMPIYALVVAPIIAVPLVAWLKALSEAPVAGLDPDGVWHFRGNWRRAGPLERPWRMHVAPLLVLLLLAVEIAAPCAGIKFKPVYDPAAYPEKAWPPRIRRLA